RIIGSSAEAIDIAEDRHRFEDFLNHLGIPQPPGGAVTTLAEALRVAELIGYPVLVRPSYVLGGRAMEIVEDASELAQYVHNAVAVASKRPILVDKYLEGKEIEVDAICDGDQVLIPGVMEHIERAGVHSGDSMAIYPGINLDPAHVETIVDYTVRIGLALQVRGLMNVQYVLYDGRVYVLEVNPRASRTVPFLSKVTGVPIVRLATLIALGVSLREEGYAGGLWKRQKLVAIKAPVFSGAKLVGVDTYLGPEMKSTGEVMGIDFGYEPALAKALSAAGLMLPREGGVLFSIADRDKPAALAVAQQVSAAGYTLYATEGTASALASVGLPVRVITKRIGQGSPDVLDILRSGEARAVVNTMTGDRDPLRDGFYIRRTAVECGAPCYTSLDTARVIADLVANGAPAYEVLPLAEYLARGRARASVEAPRER
ncbi:MAG: ATP-grasp domain-containing protein, partial [Chloroflexi bacterium]|nr:ATP-grasp domain-containing protein [Chloroflexota bacterium]